jgi:hypothetical protein
LSHISQRYCLGLFLSPDDDEGALAIVYNCNILLKLFFGNDVTNINLLAYPD